MSGSFTCKRGESTRLESLQVEDGSLIITKDTKELYADVDSERILIGMSAEEREKLAKVGTDFSTDDEISAMYAKRPINFV